MTTFFGESKPVSQQTRALDTIDASKQTFVNKDFVKNIQWLNDSVTYISGTLGSMQRGIDQANQDVIQQIEGFVADLFIIFAGGEPTGIDIGDLKYIFQSIGALLGINPDTPFPLNLIEAVWNIFTTYIIPVPQFTDIIFDAVIAWAEDLGFSDEAVGAIQEFDDAVVLLYNDLNDFAGAICSAVEKIMAGLGLGGNFFSLAWLENIINDLFGWVGNVLAGPRDLLLNILSVIVVVIFKILTFLVTVIDPMNWVRALGVAGIGPELAPTISNSTIDWSVGSNKSSGWIYDSQNSSPNNTDGSFTTNGNGVTKRIITQSKTPCSPGQSYKIGAQLKWSNIPTDHNTFGPCVVFYTGNVELSQTNVDAPAGHGASGGWEAVSQSIAVPANADGFAIGARISNSIDSGQVWVSKISCCKDLPLSDSIVGIVSAFTPLHLFQTLIELITNLFTGKKSSSSTGSSSPITSGLGGLLNNVAKFLGIDFGPDGFSLDNAVGGFVSDILKLGGISTTTTPIQPHQVAEIISPQWDKNALPDGSFRDQTTSDTQGLWAWGMAGATDQTPATTGKTLGGAIRTIRTGVIPVFFCVGTYNMPASFGAASPAEYMEGIHYDMWCNGDWAGVGGLDQRYFEWIRVPYPSAIYPMDKSVNQGDDTLQAMIERLPLGQKFILVGHSQGAQLISDIYDEIRNGSLQHRNNDFLLGIALGNPRRERGKSFPATPLNLEGPVCSGRGVYDPNLTGTLDDPRWWELSSEGDFVSAVADDSSSYWVRLMYQFVFENYGGDFDALIRVILAPWELIGFMQGIYYYYLNCMAGEGPGHPHVSYMDSTEDLGKPLLAYGDSRTYLKIVCDYINSMAAEWGTEITQGDYHEMESATPMLVEPGQVVIAKAKSIWLNMPENAGKAISIAVNVYDSDENLIDQLSSDYGAIFNPAKVTPGSMFDVPGQPAGFWGPVLPAPWPNAWQQITDTFLMPDDAKYATIVFQVYEAAMLTAIVFFDEGVLEIPQRIDASQLKNLENIDPILVEKIGGMQGIANMFDTLKHTFDGLGSAWNNTGSIENIGLADLFELAQEIQQNSMNALNYGITHQEILQNTKHQPISTGLQPTGEVNFNLPDLGEVIPTISIAAGKAWMAFVRTAKNVKKGFIEFMIEAASLPNNVFINFYLTNLTTGVKTRVWTSDDISVLIPINDYDWIQALIADAVQPGVVIGDLICIEIANAGSVALTVSGKLTGVKNNVRTQPVNYGATRTLSTSGGTSPASLTDSQLTWSGNSFFVCVGETSVPGDYHVPIRTKYSDPGSHTLILPTWIKAGDIIEGIGLGAGGGGGGSPVGLYVGPGAQGGNCGSWGVTTLIFGEDIPVNTTQLNIVTGTKGTGGATGQPGIDGLASTMAIPGGATVLYAPGGQHGGPIGAFNPLNPNTLDKGIGPGNQDYGDPLQTYFGGATTSPPSGIYLAPPPAPKASVPGAGGCTYYGKGADGSDGCVWVNIRQDIVG
jgi:hypothetical protein